MTRTLYLVFELRQSSDDLTRFIRTYTATGNVSYWEYYLNIVSIRDGYSPLPFEPYRIYWDLYVADGGPPRELTPPSALMTRMEAAGFTSEELALVQLAKNRSDGLIDLETVAYNAMLGRYRPSNTTGLTSDEALAFSITAPPNQTYAMELVHGLDYHRYKAGIMEPLDEFFVLSRSRSQSLDRIHQGMMILTTLQIVAVAMLFVILCLTTYAQYESFMEKKRLIKAQVEAEFAADAISSFQLKAVEYLEEIEKPDMLQAGFLKIMKNLKLYKPYLPPHLLGDSEAVPMSSAHRTSDRSTKSSSATSQSGSRSKGRGQVSEARERTAVGVQRRRTVALCVSCAYDNLNPGEVTDYIAKISDALVNASSDVHGTVTMTPLGQFVVAFVAGRCLSREEGALSVAKSLLRARQKKSDFVSKTAMRVGIAQGMELCGNAGGEHLRGLVYTGRVVTLAVSIAEVAKEVGSFILAEEASYRNMMGSIAVMRVKMLMKDYAYDQYLYEVLGEREVANEEWLYQLQGMEETPVARINDVIKRFLDREVVDLQEMPRVLERTELSQPYSLDWVRGDPPVYRYSTAVQAVSY
eukprot:TRINITY_DN10952_c1_g1_i1.p1 TRINITY_DN10952_c1_g1~~TRINITY_DN10952_c1_g1_i1.p1  ORF type:complete len:635 (+),score=230.46 TRINITY_DN10952_c1_g1_i1:162-1907(+)